MLANNYLLIKLWQQVMNRKLIKYLLSTYVKNNVRCDAYKNKL